MTVDEKLSVYSQCQTHIGQLGQALVHAMNGIQASPTPDPEAISFFGDILKQLDSVMKYLGEGIKAETEKKNAPSGKKSEDDNSQIINFPFPDIETNEGKQRLRKLLAHRIDQLDKMKTALEFDIEASNDED